MSENSQTPSKPPTYISRRPSEKVQRELRKEVGFSCPAPSSKGTGRCGNPYLTWHHFDPPWNVERHHNPRGMIALCREHHDKADNGAYTKEQLRHFKAQAGNTFVGIKGKIDWMRHDLILVSGTTFFQRTPAILRYNETPMIWFERDWQGYFLLNINLLPISALPGFQMRNNVWQVLDKPLNFECPPSGKRICVEYKDGNNLSIDFHEIESADKLQRRYSFGSLGPSVSFPFVAVEFQMTIKESNLKFGQKEIVFQNGQMNRVLVKDFAAAFTLRKNNFGIGSV